MVKRSVYHPGLDGLRAVAVAAVLLYHGGVAWAGGGFLGVEVFFVLSGFLITSLLIGEWSRTATIGLTRFWARRARRLLPALLTLLLAIGAYYTLAGPTRAVPGLTGAAFSTLFYTANWHEITSGSSYFATGGPASPLHHTWSLGIEEQFYLVWPLLLVAVFWLTGRAAQGGRPNHADALRAMLIVTLAAAIGSLVEVAILYRGGGGLDRVYYGTDTRAAGLLVGAGLALWLARPGLPRQDVGGPRRRLLTLASIGALGGVATAMHYARGDAGWLFPWGMLGVDLAVVVVISAVVLGPDGPLPRMLSRRPLRALGQISYGVYLWHFPLFLWLDQTATGLQGAALLTLRVTSTLAVATVSYLVIEQPIRQRRIPNWLLRPMLPAAAGGAALAILAAGAVGAQMPGNTFVPASRAVMAKYAGVDGPCAVRLGDTRLYRSVPLPPRVVGGYVFHWILRHEVNWDAGGYPNSASLTFRTCPPGRVLFIGDSIAFTAGVPMLDHESQYGVTLANAAILGCAFTTRGRIELSGVFSSLPDGCSNAIKRWQQAERRFRAQVVVVELGYRDEFDWEWSGRAAHLGQPSFDRYLRIQIARFVGALTQGGARVLLLSVPWVNPPALPNGSPAPASSPERHALINSILASVAKSDPSVVRLLNIDTIVSPGNRYRQTVEGNACRFDGIHFTTYCASLLQPHVLGAARELMDNNT